MTQIQIEYLKHLEDARHNTSTESETQRHNASTEREDVRSHQANEALGQGNLTELIRHNTVGEKETGRHNLAGEKETARHNQAAEKETGRHNLATENQAKNELSETNRHNIATETVQSAVASETGRHNLAQEGIDQEKNAISRERIRADQAIAQMQADTNKWIEQMRQNQENRRKTADLQTKRQIADEDRHSNEIQKQADRLQTALNNQNQAEIAAAQREIEKERNRIQEDYNNQIIGEKYYNDTLDFLNGLLRNATNIANSVGKNTK